MSNASSTPVAGQHQPPHHPICNHCGGVARPVAILDSSQGKNFRLLRCLRCEKATWTEEHQ
jgi:hypothetical protein